MTDLNDRDPAIAIAAEAWQLIAQVIQRYPRQDCLRVLEMRPGGGQGHVLRIVQMQSRSGNVYRDFAKPLVDFNLLSARWAVHGPDWPSWVPWRGGEGGALDFFGVLAKLSRALNLSESPEQLDRTVCGLVFLAETLNSVWGRAQQLSAVMGYIDTSGYGGGVHEDLFRFPALYRPEEQLGDGWREGLATGYWLLHNGAERELVGAIRTNGQISSAAAPNHKHELAMTYAGRRNLGDVLRAAEEMIGESKLR